MEKRQNLHPVIRPKYGHEETEMDDQGCYLGGYNMDC